MSPSCTLNQRLDSTQRRHPAFPKDAAALTQMTWNFAKALANDGHAMVKPYGLTLPEYYTLFMLGSSEDPVSVSEMMHYIGEKASNRTKLADQLLQKARYRASPANKIVAFGS